MRKITVPTRGEVSESKSFFSNAITEGINFTSKVVKTFRNTGFALAITIFAGSGALISCGTDDEVKSTNLQLKINGLENLGANYMYEGWLMVNGSPISSGRFSVNDSGILSQSSFSITSDKINAATAFILTIEPAVGDLPTPSDVHLLAGNFDGKTGTLKVSDAKALAVDFETIAGKYILATPTNANANDEFSGVWFLDNSSGSPMAGLTLPVLPSGWQYEGWVVVNGKAVTTGKFTSATGADMFNGFSSTLASPPFPGEDLLTNAPVGLTFPTDIRGGKVVISVEPVPDNSTAPFLIKPLVSDVSATAEAHKVLTLNKNLSSLPTGSFSR